MRQWWTIAAVGLALSVPAMAQRGSGGHSNGGGHASSGSFGPSGGRAPAASHTGSPRPAPRYGGLPPVRAGAARPPTTRAGYGPTARPNATNNGHTARTASSGLGSSLHDVARTRSAGRGNGNGSGKIRLGYGAPISPLGWWLGPYQFYPWLDADLSYDYWHDTGDTDTAIATASAGADMVQDAPPPRWPGGQDAGDAEDPNAPANWTATQLDSGSPALTLVYKTGQTEQVANYAVSRTAVTVIDDGGVRSVKMDDLNIPAMATANAKAGLALPQGLEQ